MKKALASQSDGVGLAAPQIGIPLRIFIVSGKIFDEVLNAVKVSLKLNKHLILFL
jgi:peptide deformylase